eukprot:CAMPEP_0176353876 /NCGR_PEP_ID=MMETSP0126-20121128/12123_1 /TAXON_ID=141414 ORGANISM="Strombidinopsis acuminatum, Strain SPMC142" /NCGR_SAMPLE_ID=MMETSP0126 /ASSEMBLY_ACC=CAM_ASM_000229 /LENGTH=165 /DNA_ID=CAMNT_0017705745 /DNA_START=7 /DNA_END=504 /DNA_ORIENTATION=+
MKTFAAVCACAFVASSVDAKLSTPLVKQDGDFSPEGNEWVQLIAGAIGGAYKDLYKQWTNYNCQSMMYGWSYDIYAFWSFYNESATFSDDPVKGLFTVAWFFLDGMATFGVCRDEADGIPSESINNVPINFLNAGYQVLELKDAYDEENYFSTGFAFTNAITRVL